MVLAGGPALPMWNTATVLDARTRLFRLADGESLRLDCTELHAVYEQLWTNTEQSGAVSTAALLLHALQASNPLPVELDGRQSFAFRLARSRLRRAS